MLGLLGIELNWSNKRPDYGVSCKSARLVAEKIAENLAALPLAANPMIK